LKKKTLLLTGTTGFIGYKFLSYALKNNFLVIDILRVKNKNNKKIKKLKKFYPNLYKNIFFSSASDLSKKLKNIKIDYFINFATLYNNNHTYDQISKFINSNIMFPSLIYDLINNKTKKIINFGTMMQHSTSKLLTSQNFYTATKNAFEMISNYYAYKNNKTRFYNLKFYESFGDNDRRKKIIPTLIKNYKNNSTTKILSKQLSLNIIHTDDIINSIMILLNNNIKSGSYCIKNDHNIKIYNLINTLNKGLNRKIKVKYGNKSTKVNFKNKLNNLPKWKPIKNLKSKIIKTFKNEANKN
jgi:CDP-paratose synthetase